MIRRSGRVRRFEEVVGVVVRSKGEVDDRGVRLRGKAEVPAKLPIAYTVDSVVIGRIKGRRVVRSRGVLWS